MTTTKRARATAMARPERQRHRQCRGGAGCGPEQLPAFLDMLPGILSWLAICCSLLQSSTVAIADRVAPLFGFLLSVKCKRRNHNHGGRRRTASEFLIIFQPCPCGWASATATATATATFAAFSFISSFSQELLQHSEGVVALAAALGDCCIPYQNY